MIYKNPIVALVHLSFTGLSDSWGQVVKATHTHTHTQQLFFESQVLTDVKYFKLNCANV